MVKVAQVRESRLLIGPLGLLAVDLAYKIGTDPLNAIKLCVLGVIAALCLADILASPQIHKKFKDSTALKVLSGVLSLFLFFLIVAVIMSPVKSVAFLGDSNRNLGFFNYLFLAVIAMHTALSVTISNIKSIYFAALGLGTIFSVYGLFQHFNIDFVHWVNEYNPIILMTGNPDFSSSLLGIITVVCCACFFLNVSKAYKVGVLLLLLFLLVIIYWTRARQGLVGVAAGVGFILFVALLQRKKIYAFILLFLEIILFVFLTLGTFRIGPLSHLMFKASVNDRGYAWRAAIGMLKSHPLFGVGVDRYNAYFLQYVSPKYPLINGYSLSVNNAHNVFLQMFATSGIFLGIAYISWLSFVGYRAFNLLRKSSGQNRILATGIIGGWIVYLAQSIISIDAQVISIWGWMLGGSIVGLSCGDFSDSGDKNSVKKVQPPQKVKRNKAIYFSSQQLVTSVVLLIPLFLLLITPVIRNESNTFHFSSTPFPANDTLSREAYLVSAQKVFNQPLINVNYQVNIAIDLAKNNYAKESVQDLKEIIKKDPRCANAYLVLSLVLENLKQVNEAILYRKSESVISPYNAENLLLLTRDYLLVGDKQSAKLVRDKILLIAPDTDISRQVIKLI